MIVDDVVINKVTGIERCLAKIRLYSGENPDTLLTDELRQEAIMLNLQRACESAIDLAMHITREKKLKIPQTSRNAFEILGDAGLITSELVNRMRSMVGFRNIAIHEYHKLDPKIIVSIVQNNLQDFTNYIAAIKNI